MRVVWLGWEDIYTTRRVKETAQAMGIGLDVCSIHDISFGVQDGHFVTLGNNVNLTETYDGLVVRTFYPYVSEALTLARLFSDAGKVVIDHSLTNEGYAISKMHDYLVLTEHGLPCPRTWQIFNPRLVEKQMDRFQFPCVLKGTHGARGENVFLAENPDQMMRRMWHYPCGELMVQEYLPAVEDYRVMVIGYEALPVMISRRPPKGDFRTNYAIGGHFRGHALETFPGFGELGVAAARALSREFTGVDIRMKGDQPLILEVNRQPDFEGFERATKFDVAAEVVRYIEKRVKDWEKRKQEPAA